MIESQSIRRKNRVFDSVFQGQKLFELTPPPTPIPGPASATRGRSIGSHERSRVATRGTEDSNVRTDQRHWLRSWQVVTHLLSLSAITAGGNPLVDLRSVSLPQEGSQFKEHLKDVLYAPERLPHASDTEDLIIWHTHQVRRHFLNQVLPILQRLDEIGNPDELLSVSVEILDAAQQQYSSRLQIIITQLESDGCETISSIVEKFRQDLHAIISHSVTGHMIDAFRIVLARHVSTVLGLPLTVESRENRFLLSEEHMVKKSYNDLLGLVRALGKVGLAGEKLQVIFAEIMNSSMSEYVYQGCKGVWNLEASGSQRTNSVLPRTAHHVDPSRCVTDLCEWVERRYWKLAVAVSQVLDGVDITSSDLEMWKEMGIDSLARLRTSELFDIVVSWPRSHGALHDLRTTITTPQRRLQLTEAFARTLNQKLLHPGTSTLQILQLYISMISSFHALDHSKVLLDRVAYPLQLYLCSREDTVRIVITGLLADVLDSEGSPIKPGGDKLIELALLLDEKSTQVGQRAAEEDLDWHDMDWVPDPVDAGPGYKRSKNADIIGTLIGVLGSQEVFIKEFQNVMGENMLKYTGGFQKEIRVLELLKKRFGEAPLQSCEVMLKDVQDSGQVDAMIRRYQQLEPSAEEVAEEGHFKPSIHAKILSRLFWPQLHDENYKVPTEIAELQKRYETGFRDLKVARKLTWLHALGQATVELDLADRVIYEEVHTWQATVIWAFQSEDSDVSLRRSVQELELLLEMDETLVRSALNFWVGKMVLREVSPDNFVVLETLNTEDRARSNAQAAAAVIAEESTDDGALVGVNSVTSDKLKVYWQFTKGMLTNQGQMPLQQIGMMLRMLLPEGFPHTNEELQEILGSKVGEGELEFAGGKYKLKK